MQHTGRRVQRLILAFVAISSLDLGIAMAQTSPAGTVAEPVPAAADASAPVPTAIASPPSVQPAPAAASEPPPASAPPPEPPRIVLEKDPPLPPPVQRTDHTHDGFYARLSLGFGNLGTTMNAPNSGAIKGDGSTLDLDVALGYAVRPGIILGATLMFESLPSAQMDAFVPVTSDVTTSMLGAFFDGYPNARGGFHLGGGLGFASANVQREQVAGFTKAAGFGLAGWLGYDVWVAEQWSAGVLLRMMGTRTKADAVLTENNDAGNATMATQSIALMLTGVYN